MHENTSKTCLAGEVVSDIRHVNYIDASRHPEQFACQLRYASIAGRREADFAWIGPGIGDELRNDLGRDRCIHHHDDRHTHDVRNWRNVANGVEVEVLVERRLSVNCTG
jgi:hypothetical protein